jgi:hypothetical protein
LVAQYKREAVSASIGQPTSPSQRDSAIPVTPNPPNRVRARPVLHLEEPAALPPQLHDCSSKVVAPRMAGARPRRILATMAASQQTHSDYGRPGGGPPIPHVTFIMRPMNETRYKEVLNGSAR